MLAHHLRHFSVTDEDIQVFIGSLYCHRMSRGSLLKRLEPMITLVQPASNELCQFSDLEQET